MFWYLQALKKYTDFSGRARRKEYWTFTLFNAAIYFVVCILVDLDAAVGVGSSLASIALVYLLVTVVPQWAVSTRRLHDTHHSGWWQLVALVPLIGTIPLLVWYATDSDRGTNEYGPNPKDAARSELVCPDNPGLAVSRKRASWIVPVVIAVVAVIAGGLLYVANRGTADARVLAACTGIAASAEQVANPDLMLLGLQAVGTRDARSLYGDTFADAAVVEYSANGQPTAVVAVLRYSTSAEASGDFDGLAGWAQDSCGRWSSVNVGSKGVIRCYLSDGHDMILRSDNWILDVETADANGVPAPRLAEQIRDAIVTHWQGLSSGS